MIYFIKKYIVHDKDIITSHVNIICSDYYKQGYRDATINVLGNVSKHKNVSVISKMDSILQRQKIDFDKIDSILQIKK